MTSTGTSPQHRAGAIPVGQAFVVTVMTHPTAILRSRSQTTMRTPGDAVVVIQRDLPVRLRALVPQEHDPPARIPRSWFGYHLAQHTFQTRRNPYPTWPNRVHDVPDTATWRNGLTGARS